MVRVKHTYKNAGKYALWSTCTRPLRVERTIVLEPEELRAVNSLTYIPITLQLTKENHLKDSKSATHLAWRDVNTRPLLRWREKQWNIRGNSQRHTGMD
ncbi:hypothetical protein NDU88_001604 [Pleurodeles waltl]|uniref:Uncharacterized protein n=1 Tax=Pleurodeles waltl TaxID=8319 RepID=A0AAV7UAV7_PLEWA|nr:hypothetical protein NDU88_001604 [Pleurodeles waltl]